MTNTVGANERAKKPVNSEMWLAVHIPKTAGTSFRLALEKCLGRSQVVLDYGPQSTSTTAIVQKCLYDESTKNNTSEFINTISRSGFKALVGHFPAEKYARFFEPSKIISFVRNPLVRICSEYLHRVESGTFSGSFQDYLQKPAFQNIQSQYLRHISSESFIGITEYFNESLRRINDLAHWSLSIRKRNVGRRGGGRRLARNLSEYELELFYKSNAEDVLLYKKLTQRFKPEILPEDTKQGLIEKLFKKHITTISP